MKCHMDSVERLAPVAVKQSAKLKAMALVTDGYVQADEKIQCLACEVCYLLLLDPRDRVRHRHETSQQRHPSIAFFRQKITQDHDAGHPHDRFVMP